MPNWTRSTLTWMVAAEFIVVGALIVVAWNVVGSATRPVAAAPAIQAPDSSADATSPLPDVPLLNPRRGVGPLPGLNIDSAFWRARLEELNRQQGVFEALQWGFGHSAQHAAMHSPGAGRLPSVPPARQQ